ncbi:MAG: hypothetical protein ACRDOY_08285, partial [Nocardioidaceae bacterium]
MRATYRVLAYLIAIGVFLQAAAVAFAWFDVINSVEAGQVFSAGSEGNIGHVIHGVVGMNIMPIIALLLLIISFFAKVPGAWKWALGIVLAVAVQIVVAIMSFETPWLGALHGVNALIILGLALTAA